MFHLDGKIVIESAQSSSAGRKMTNDDAVVVHCPDDEHLITHKGIVAAIADGVSSADAGREAANICTERFIDDFYASPDIWTTPRSAENVLTTLNRELYNKGKTYRNAERGYVCTLSILILKSHTAHLFHIGDTRIYRLRDGTFKQLTEDHSLQVSANQNYLSRAMGLDNSPQIDYSTTDIQADDLFLLTTDGIHDHVDERRIITLLDSNRNNLPKRKFVFHLFVRGNFNPNLSGAIPILINTCDSGNIFQFFFKLAGIFAQDVIRHTFAGQADFKDWENRCLNVGNSRSLRDLFRKIRDAGDRFSNILLDRIGIRHIVIKRDGNDGTIFH